VEVRVLFREAIKTLQCKKLQNKTFLALFLAVPPEVPFSIDLLLFMAYYGVYEATVLNLQENRLGKKYLYVKLCNEYTYDYSIRRSVRAIKDEL